MHACNVWNMQIRTVTIYKLLLFRQYALPKDCNQVLDTRAVSVSQSKRFEKTRVAYTYMVWRPSWIIKLERFGALSIHM